LAEAEEAFEPEPEELNEIDEQVELLPNDEAQ
jgi:hypothetical protein